ncbi:hypothetical protein L3V79_06105 [Thiotrichales bacterium 19S9-12]|nr:hypothetical protein [Thiotrichales bacterium 19S9-11]MCF6811931.1 hypothetical protein [Thiotrichales bacterium 19S9-12]
MKSKKGLKFLGIILGIIIIAFIVLWLSINYVTAYLIEEVGSSTLGTEVTVSGVNISALKGEASISELKVANVEGYQFPNIVTLNNISAKIDTSTIKSDTVVVDYIIIDKPHLYYEINAKNKSNLNVLQDNVEKNTNSTETSKKEDEKVADTSSDVTKTKEEKEATKVVIKELIIRDTEVDAKVAALGDKTIQVNISEIKMKNLGQATSGETTRQIINQVLKVVVTEVVKSVANKGVKDSIGESLNKAANSLKCRLSPSSCE